MFKKIVKNLWKLRIQFLKYTIIGSTGFILDMLTLIGIKEGFGLDPILSVIINQLLMINYIFFLNKYWTFKVKGIARKQMVRFWLLMGWNYIFAVLVMWLGNSILDFNYIYVRILSIFVTVTWNFVLYKFWVFVDIQVCIRSVLRDLYQSLFCRK